jgi:hypothetical protein
MKLVLLRLLEILIATLITGVILLVYNGITTGDWQFFMVAIVPLGFIWSMYLGVLAVSNIAMGAFLVLALVVVLAAYLIARFGPSRWVRLSALTVLFLVHQMALIVLFAMFGVSG